MEINDDYPRCLTPVEQYMNGTEFESFLQRYVLPPLTIFGIVGNCLNLCVLLAMRTRSNTFLSMLALADIVFLALLWPNILANVPFFTFLYEFRYFYYWTRIHLLATTNWVSAIAIWCVIAVCAERLIGILRPLYVREYWPRWKMPAVISVIIGTPFLLTIYQHVEYECRAGHFCNGTQIYQKCLKINDETWFSNSSNPYSLEYRRFLNFALHVYVDMMILLPIILLSILNFALIYPLRRRRLNVLEEARQGSAASIDCLLTSSRNSNVSLIVKTEQRVTLSVVLIVTVFTVTNGPSAILQIVRTSCGIPSKQYYGLMLISNVMVIVGNASNFILFCLGSRHFRRRLYQTLIGKFRTKHLARQANDLKG